MTEDNVLDIKQGRHPPLCCTLAQALTLTLTLTLEPALALARPPPHIYALPLTLAQILKQTYD